MSVSKSMTDVAFDIMSKKKRAVAFDKLWQEVSRATGAPLDLIAQFYSDLTLDGRFLSLKDNKWDLKARRKFSESQIDLSELEVDDDTDDIYDDEGNVIDDPDEEY